jgi:hypothetical protein
VSDCCVMSNEQIFQLYHDKNQLLFNEISHTLSLDGFSGVFVRACSPCRYLTTSGVFVRACSPCRFELRSGQTKSLKLVFDNSLLSMYV